MPPYHKEYVALLQAGKTILSNLQHTCQGNAYAGRQPESHLVIRQAHAFELRLHYFGMDFALRVELAVPKDGAVNALGTLCLHQIWVENNAERLVPFPFFGIGMQKSHRIPFKMTAPYVLHPENIQLPLDQEAFHVFLFENLRSELIASERVVVPGAMDLV